MSESELQRLSDAVEAAARELQAAKVTAEANHAVRVQTADKQYNDVLEPYRKRLVAAVNAREDYDLDHAAQSGES